MKEKIKKPKALCDKYVAENRIKKGSNEVEKKFLLLIEDWRESLAKNIALRNRSINQGVNPLAKATNPSGNTEFALNQAVQVILDRIIFLRIAEDRNMEKYGMLLECIHHDATSKDAINRVSTVYADLNKIFLKANDKYNSGLFKPKKWISDLDIDDKAILDIIKYLYYPECPFEFSGLPIEILGNIYEQFLGKTIRLTSSHQVKIEEKVGMDHDPSLRKAGGVYYTPQYIVNYIVENTVGEILLRTSIDVNQGVNPLANATNTSVDLYYHPKLTILDPACGSGNFLVGAYSFLLDKYLESYTDKKRLDKSLKNGLIYQIENRHASKDAINRVSTRDVPTYRLSITVKQDILLHHIFGVDIDNQAVEVTKLSLLLKLMEDENTESADRLFKYSDVKLLPDLSNNIKCGNSLISSDFYSDKNISLFSKEEMRKVNTFDWEKEFASVFNPSVGSGGGFDCVIGNPPWVSAWTEVSAVRNYITSQYLYLKGHWDTYLAFLVRGLYLMNKKGVQSFILPSSILTEKYATDFRKYLTDSKKLKQINLYGASKVFENVSRKVVILFINNAKTDNSLIIGENVNDILKIKKSELSIFATNENYIFNTQLDQKLLLLKNKIEKVSVKLGNFFYINYGVQISSKVKGKFSQDFLLSKVKKGNAKKCLKGNSVKRFQIFDNGLFLDYQKEIMYGPRSERFFESKKIIVNKISDNDFNLQAVFDNDKYYCDQRLICLVKYLYLEGDPLYKEFKDYKIFNTSCDENYFLGIINSKLLSWYFKNFIATKNLQGNYSDVLPVMVRGLPILDLNLTIKEQKAQHDKFVSPVKQMLSTQKEFQSATSCSNKKLLQQKCDLLDKQIDKLVYELYGLTEDEIKIVSEL